MIKYLYTFFVFFYHLLIDLSEIYTKFAITKINSPYNYCL